jgi:hypothetical protein
LQLIQQALLQVFFVQGWHGGYAQELQHIGVAEKVFRIKLADMALFFTPLRLRQGGVDGLPHLGAGSQQQGANGLVQVG